LLYGYGLPTLLHHPALVPTFGGKAGRAALLPDAGGDRIGARLVGASSEACRPPS
jgi:hypothetical protein